MTADPGESSRARLAFWASVALFWLYFAVQSAVAPDILDDWYQIAFIKKHGLSLGSFIDNARFNYHEYNPRIGENWLLLVNGPRWIHTLLTPTVAVGFFFLAFAVAFGRWPRPGAADGQRLLIVTALVWLASPIPGILFVYRPFTTNYVYALALTLLLIVPYRIVVERALAPRWWMIPAMFALGWAAGMGNEHTGPTVFVALAGLVYAAWRLHRRFHAWMITGLAGLAIGYPMLFFAPGQKKRYGSIAARQGPLDHITERGPDGLWEIVLQFLWEAQLAVVLVLVGVFVALLRAHAAGRPAPAPDRRTVVLVLALLVPAFAVVATLFASPTTGERLFFASATMFALAGAVLCDVVAAERSARRAMVGVALGALLIHGTWGAVTYATIAPEGRDRNARLAAAARARPGEIAYVPPLSKITRNLWFLGEDFDYASLREFVGHEVYGLGGIELDRPLRAEPTVPFKARIEFTMDPPMAQAEVWRRLVMPLSYVSAYPDRDVRLIRRLLPQLEQIPGHRVVEVVAHVDGFAPPELRGRPFLGTRWRATTGEFEVIDQLVRADDDLRVYILLRNGTFPAGLTDGYLHGCGRTRTVDLVRDERGLRMAYVPWCRGLMIAQACTATECWLAGTYWH